MALYADVPERYGSNTTDNAEIILDPPHPYTVLQI